MLAAARARLVRVGPEQAHREAAARRRAGRHPAAGAARGRGGDPRRDDRRAQRAGVAVRPGLQPRACRRPATTCASSCSARRATPPAWPPPPSRTWASAGHRPGRRLPGLAAGGPAGRAARLTAARAERRRCAAGWASPAGAGRPERRRRGGDAARGRRAGLADPVGAGQLATCPDLLAGRPAARRPREPYSSSVGRDQVRDGARASQRKNHSLVPGRRCSTIGVTLAAPAAAMSPRPPPPAGRGSRTGTAGPAPSARRSAARARLRAAQMPSRRAGLGVPGSTSRDSSLSTNPTDTFRPTSVTCAASAIRSRSRRISVPLVRIENGLRGVAQRADDAGHELVAALGPLVAVHVGAHGDVLARPARRGQLPAASSGALTLTTTLESKSVPGVQVQVGVGVAGEAVHAGVSAAAVRVDRPAERPSGTPRAPG